MLAKIRKADARLTERFSEMLVVNYDLDRKLVSFQANKSETRNRWCKYKEGFSAALMRYVFNKLGIKSGPILDPFAGSGTALFAASEIGIDSVGIELLPCAAEIVEVRRMLQGIDGRRTADAIRKFKAGQAWEKDGKRRKFSHLRITAGAFPAETEWKLERYMYEVEQVKEKRLSRVLRFAAFCVLESISYTRKDGQYLRWDWRSPRMSNRRFGRKRFEKGPLLDFTKAVSAKLEDIARDVSGDGLLFDVSHRFDGVPGKIELMGGSCLDILPVMGEHLFEGIVTSPPYCNRYDYTRTYALELAMLGIDEKGIKDLRQTMLSCTVENREKENLGSMFPQASFRKAMEACSSQEALTPILAYLDLCLADGTINNRGIPRMVRNYFQEMSLVIFECARVLRPGGALVMVNDNVRYQGAHVPVDLILSDFAEQAGLEVESIWVLPRGKGNSSQQMGLHGREEIRKCVYVWRKKISKASQARLPSRQLAYA